MTEASLEVRLRSLKRLPNSVHMKLAVAWKNFQNLNDKATKEHTNLELQEKHCFTESETKAQYFISTHPETWERWKQFIKNPSSMTTFFRSSRPEVFCKKGILRNFTKFTGKHLWIKINIKPELPNFLGAFSLGIFKHIRHHNILVRNYRLNLGTIYWNTRIVYK